MARDLSKKEKTNKNKETSFGHLLSVCVIGLLVILMAVPTFSLFTKRGRGEGIVLGRFATEKIIYSSGQGYNMDEAFQTIINQYSLYGLDSQLLVGQKSIWEDIFQLGVFNAGADYYAKKAGVHVSDDEVNEYILKEYLDENGVFNKKDWLEKNELERKITRQYTKNNLIRNKINNDIKILPVPQEELDVIFQEKQKKEDSDVKIYKSDVLKDIENMAEARFRDSLINSSLLVNDFENVYQKEIEPLFRPQETNTKSQDSTNSNTNDIIDEEHSEVEQDVNSQEEQPLTPTETQSENNSNNQ